MMIKKRKIKVSKRKEQKQESHESVVWKVSIIVC